MSSKQDLLKALKEIAEGKGAYSRDAFEHARNTINNMKEIANQAIAKAEGLSERREE